MPVTCVRAQNIGRILTLYNTQYISSMFFVYAQHLQVFGSTNEADPSYYFV